MRILGRSILLLCLFAFIWLGYYLWLDFAQQDHLNVATPYPNAVTERNDVYLLSNTTTGASTSKTDSLSSTLSFQLDQRVERLQISTIAMFPLSDETPEAFNRENVDFMRQQDQHPAYSIEYTLLDEQNNRLSQNTYWFDAKPSRWVYQQQDLKENGIERANIESANIKSDLVPEVFLSDSRFHAGTRQNIFLRMSHWPNARRLEVRLKNQPPEIAGAAIYVRQNFSRTQKEATRIWRKLSKSKRTSLTEGVNMYPHYIWSSAEIDALLSRYWQHLGPDGVVGEDFTTLGLYRVTGARPTTLKENISPALPASTLIVDNGQNLTFPIHVAGEVRLNYKPLAPKRQHQALTLTFHNADGSAPVIIQQPVSDEAATWQGNLQKGLLDLSSDQAIKIEIEHMPDEESEHHKKHLKRYFLVTPEQPLNYPVEHWQRQPTPVHIKTRALISQLDQAKSQPSQVTGQSSPVTSSNTIITANWITDKTPALNTSLTHNLSINFQPSRYERVAGAQQVTLGKAISNRVSVEKSSYYLAPESVNTLKITATSPVLVDVSTRPYKLPLLRHIPTHNRSWFDDESYIPTWFNLRPKHYHTLISQGSSVMLQTQHRPLPDKEASLNDQFTSEQIPPSQADSNLNQILVPEHSEEKLVSSSPVRRYRQFIPASVQAHQSKPLNFSNMSPQRTLTPSLIYEREDSSPLKVDFSLDNQVIHSQWITGQWGKITLPQLEKGSRGLTVSSRAENWFINQVDYKNNERYLIQKDAYSLTKQGRLSYNINKSSADTLLNFTYYRESTNKTIEDTLIEVRLLSAKPHQSATQQLSSSMTIPIRHWRLSPSSASTEHGLLLNRGDRKTDTGTRFVYRLGDDLPEGEYKIQFNLLEGAEGYFNVSRLTPKPGVDIDFFRESTNAY